MNDAASISRPRTLGSAMPINVRNALRVQRLRQSQIALAAAARMTLLLPLLQGLLLVGVLNAEPWIGLLCLEGLLIGGLAASQLRRARAESRMIGFGTALLNAALLGVLGVFLGSHVFWLLGAVAMLPVTALVLLPTAANTVRKAWAAYITGMALALGLGVASRVALAISPGTPDPATRQLQLTLAWGAFAVRGGNGTERALLRLRQAQTAFEAKDYARAFDLAHDGLMSPDGAPRGIPASTLARELWESLMLVKAQARYNHQWGKDDPAVVPVKPEALDPSILGEKDIAVRWGY